MICSRAVWIPLSRAGPGKTIVGAGDDRIAGNFVEALLAA
jgi:hypothetical protein